MRGRRLVVFWSIVALLVSASLFSVVSMPTVRAQMLTHRIDFVGGETLPYTLTGMYFTPQNTQSVIGGILQTPGTTQNPCGGSTKDAYVSVQFDVDPDWYIVRVRARTLMTWNYQHSGAWASLWVNDTTGWRDNFSAYFSPAHQWTNGSISVDSDGISQINFWGGTCWGAPNLKMHLEWIEIDYQIESATPTPTPVNTLSPTPTVIPLQDGDWSYPVLEPHRYKETSQLAGRLDPYATPSDLIIPFTGLQDDPISAAPYTYFFPTEPGTIDVHAIVNGTVRRVKPMVNATLCSRGGDEACFLFLTDFGVDIYVYYENMYQIDVELADGKFIRYFVSQPTVTEGKPIVAGCVIGKTLRLSRGVLQDSEPYGAVFIQGIDIYGDIFSLLPYIGVEPTPRNCTERLSMQCALIADATFEGDPRWRLEPDPVGQGTSRFLPGGGLQLLGSATQKINLDPLRPYSIVMNYTPIYTNAPRFFLQIGDSEPYEIYDDYAHRNQVGVSVTWTQDNTIYTPNDDDFFDIRIFTEQGQETSGIRLDYFCLFDTELGNVQPPGGCLLYNHEFESSGDNVRWSVAAPSGPLPAIQSGLAIMYDETSISQSLNLRPKTTGSQGYRISVLARRAGVQADSEYVDIRWFWGSFSGTLSPYRSGNFQDGTDTFTVSLAQTNDLVLTLDTSNSPSISTAHIDRVCITTSDGANPPGYLDPPVIEANCKACIYVPTGDITTDLAELVQWMGCMLLSLWECSVKSVMVGIWQTLVMILTAIGYLRMWFGMVFDNIALWTNGNINAVAAWAGRELWNLGTRFENALTNTISVTNIVSGGGANLGDVLLGLINGLRDVIVTLFTSIGEPIINLLSRFVDGIFGLAFAIINLIAALILLVVGLLQGFLTTSLGTIMGIFQAIVNGFAMSPVAAAPDWLIYCTDPTGATPVEGPLAYLCTGIWLMEQQFRSGPAQYFIPIFIGLSVLSLLLWGAQKLLDTIAGISQ